MAKEVRWAVVFGSACAFLVGSYLTMTSMPAIAEAPADSTSADVSFMKIETKVKDLPEEIRKLDPAGDLLNEDYPYEVSFALVNDSVFPPKGADDNGYTHGAHLAGAVRVEGGIRLTIAYSTDLFTKAVPGPDPKDDKYFTNEDVLRFMADNVDAGHAWYWRDEIGWMRLGNDLHCTVLDGTCHQIWFHKLLNHVKRVSSPVYFPDGRGDQDSVIGGGGLGLHQKIAAGPFQIDTREEAGGMFAQIPGVSHFYSTVHGEAAYVLKGEYRFTVGGGATMKVHAHGVEYDPEIDAKMETRRWTFGLEYTFYRGDVMNYQLYNLPSAGNGKYDPILKAYVGYRFKRR